MHRRRRDAEAARVNIRPRLILLIGRGLLQTRDDHMRIARKISAARFSLMRARRNSREPRNALSVP